MIPSLFCLERETFMSCVQIPCGILRRRTRELFKARLVTQKSQRLSFRLFFWCLLRRFNRLNSLRPFARHAQLPSASLPKKAVYPPRETSTYCS